ncbi:hypothetical protein J7F03_11825 [Streptomyces sp. ISL-43]|uniref:hypothetical protein n=1 Tax=Streptomyces sp. ISL-43 TaxID=2819183 RepID=UPI001BE711A2|nr:hypothetical protein [Streptomyces sp. ISL-43]MBT2447750.1 hypothetical protein [Streptomyces sp. ISL-43]
MRLSKKFLVLPLAAASLIIGSGAAHATSTTISVPFKNGTTTWFTTERTISVAGSNVDVKVSYGGAMKLAWYKCSDRNVRGTFTTAEEYRKHLGTNFKSGAKFCLAVQSAGGEGTINGTLWWNE